MFSFKMSKKKQNEFKEFVSKKFQMLLAWQEYSVNDLRVSDLIKDQLYKIEDIEFLHKENIRLTVSDSNNKKSKFYLSEEVQRLFMMHKSKSKICVSDLIEDQGYLIENFQLKNKGKSILLTVTGSNNMKSKFYLPERYNSKKGIHKLFEEYFKEYF